MKRKIALILAAVSCVMLLGAGKSNFVGYDKAKESGLAFLRTAYGLEATDVKSKLCAKINRVVIDGTGVGKESATAGNFYHVAVFDPKENYPYYTAEVNAITGVAYRAQYARRYIHLTKEQENKANSLGALESFVDFDFSQYKQDAADAARSFVQDHFAAKDAITSVFPQTVRTESDIFPMVDVDSLVIMKSGAVYQITVCWPSMTVIDIQLLGED